MAKDVQVNFKLDEDMADWLKKTAFDMDETASDVIRACILLSLDTIKSTPSLIRRIAFEDRKSK